MTDVIDVTTLDTEAPPVIRFTYLAKELARTVLPLGTYTEWYWQTDLHNFLGMLGLRLDPHAQYEIRVFAKAMLDLARPHFPTIIAAWIETLPPAVAEAANATP